MDALGSVTDSVARGLSTEKLDDVRGQAQLRLLRKSMDQDEQNIQQVIQSLPEPAKPVKPAVGQPGANVDTYA
ncbi:putative motility protein [Uliginosibacterium sediminicola]|uniref:Motility protein n=1 Tax=Uliginosibacterium sediminicola TaxID=2024550 RepID=A0ABU9Z3C2_9RHOO